MTESPDREERTLAAVAHGSVLMFGTGLVAAIVIWATQKDKSRYVAFQSLQALAYQLVGLLFFILTLCCWLALYGVSFIPLMTAPEGDGGALAFFVVANALLIVPFAIMGIWTLGGLWAGVRSLQGRDFHYAFIGQQVKRWLATH
jgi:uncharacterized Tic20 family protein